MLRLRQESDKADRDDSKKKHEAHNQARETAGLHERLHILPKLKIP